MQINCPCCGNAFEIESEPIVGQHVVCPFCSGKFSYADAGNQNEDLHRGDALEECHHEKIVIRCHECGTEYEIDNDAIGSKCQCGICNRDFIARDDSSVEIGEAQERDSIAGRGEIDVEDKDDSSEQSGKELPTKERSAFFTQTFLLVVKAKNRISALWKLGVGRISVILTKERMNAVCLKAKEISTETKNQIVRLWKSGMKGKAFLCVLAALVLWLGFFLMCGGGPKAGDVKTIKLPSGATMELVYCPPGTFMMGSPASEEGRSEDETQHQVTLTRGFWIGKYEVTQEQWESVMGNNPSRSKGKQKPVENVTKLDCDNFCLKLGGGLRLPTEAEWEYSCRAGSTTAVSGTGDLKDMGWCDGGETHEVGQKHPNAWGIYDMHGNVCEWCADNYGEYPKVAVENPLGPISLGNLFWINRGGAYAFQARICRSAKRWPRRPSDTSFGWEGFRVACTAGAAIIEPDHKDRRMLGQNAESQRTKGCGGNLKEYGSSIGSSELRGARKFIKEHIAKNNNCRICAITQGGGNVVVCGKNNWASIGCSQLITEELQKVTDEGKLIVDVTLTEYGRFIAIYGDGTASWKGIPSEMEKFLRAYHDRFEDVLSVALNDDGAWILVTSDHFACSGTKLKGWIDEGQRQYGRLRAAALTTEAAVAVFEDGFCFLGDVPSDLKEALKEAKFDVRNIKIAGRAWFIASEDGNSYQGNL